MKTETEITLLRRRLLDAWVPFAKRYDLPVAGVNSTAEQLHWMAMGAMSFADAILTLDRPDNLGGMIATLEVANAKANSHEDRKGHDA